MGTPEFAVPSLSALIQSRDHELLFAVTQPDKPQGRGMRLQSPPVKETAMEKGLPVLQPATLKGASDMKDLLFSSRLDAVIGPMLVFLRVRMVHHTGDMAGTRKHKCGIPAKALG